MSVLRFILVFVLFSILFSLLRLGVGILLYRTKRFHRLGIQLIAMSVLVSGKFISSRCHQDCRYAKCGNWNCDHYYICKQSKSN